MKVIGFILYQRDKVDVALDFVGNLNLPISDELDRFVHIVYRDLSYRKMIINALRT